VSVIVPTRDRAKYLGNLLQALSRQTYPRDLYEVIVVDNSSTDGTKAVVEAAIHDGQRVRYLTKQNDGPAASRNRGAEMATGDILAFTDSDCLPSPNWIAEGVRAFSEGVGVVCGPILPVPSRRDDPFFVHQINPVTREEGLYPTANVFYRRPIFLSLGGFDERSRTYSWGQPIGGDDTEMAWRVRGYGYRSAFAPQAVVNHQASKVSPREYMLNSVQAQVVPRMVAVAPEIREMCFSKRYFLSRQNAFFYLFLTAIAGSRVSRWSLILTLPWLRSVVPILSIDAWPPQRWARAALRLLLHIQSSLLLVAALLYGSIRHRRLVL
jgi:glycosyltransferase involved in cell wall biosynthesis